MAIKFNYQETMNQAKKLDELAGDMQNQCCKKMSEICENIGAAWTGQASSNYCKHMAGVRDDLQKKAKYLRDLAEFLRGAAKKIQAADAAAKQATQQI